MKRVLAYRIRNGSLYRDGLLEFDTMEDLDKALDGMKCASDESGGNLSYVRFWRR